MRQRGDLDCLHEPSQAWYQGEDPLWPRFSEGDKTTPGLTPESVWEDLQTRADKGPAFIDFLHYINHLWDPDFLAHFTHAFLIRDPAKTLTSMYNKWSTRRTGGRFSEQRALFDLLSALTGRPPPVMTAMICWNTLKRSPAFCAAVDIPFIAEALSWEAGGTLGPQLVGRRILPPILLSRPG